MKIETVSLGIWLPRASMHLKEMYDFLRGDKTPLPGLDSQKLAKLLKELEVESVRFIREVKTDSIYVSCKKIEITISEEGIIVLQTRVKNPIEFSRKDLKFLEDFFVEKFSPAIKYLFSLGAPLPKELQHVREAYPIIITTWGFTEKELRDFIQKQNFQIYSEHISPALDFFFGSTVSIINIKGELVSLPQLIQDIVFLKEFPLHLANYLRVHRTIWEKINKMRGGRSIAYKDLMRLRGELNEFLKTLSLMKARLAQMDDIIETRRAIQQSRGLPELRDLKIDRIDNLIGDVRYTKDLWEMTIEYTKDSLHLIESLAQENIQRELSALKFVTLIGAITSFFGMNIAFPWEERWPNIFESSLVVVGIIVLTSVLFYYFLKIFIYNRKFTINSPL